MFPKPPGLYYDVVDSLLIVLRKKRNDKPYQLGKIKGICGINELDWAIGEELTYYDHSIHDLVAIDNRLARIMYLDEGGVLSSKE